MTAEPTSKGIRRLGRAGMKVMRSGAGLLGQDLLKRQYYTPVPQPNELPPDTFDRRDPMLGIDLDLDRQLGLLAELAPLIQEFENPHGFFDNIMYGGIDAHCLYALVRAARPQRVIELGSGSTSLVISAACERNAAEGAEADYRAFDPFPSPLVTEGRRWLPRVERVGAADVPLAEFEALEAGDVLFIDTTHTVKIGSEVNRLILEVLPRLAPGVAIHFHDIFLPYSYPRAYLERHLFFAEQYLLQGFLAFNAGFEVALAAHALYRDRGAELAAAVAVRAADVLPDGPSSFWIRRT